MKQDPLKSPFPWFGGKSRAASLIWERFGDVPNYVEPFAGSLAVLLGRPHDPGTETVNDIDCFLANAWRALQADPSATAAYASGPVNEADLHARHLWLIRQDEFRERMKTDPDHFDPKVAGWWIWGQCSWIGSGWCRNAGMGVHRKLPHLGDAGRGVNRQLPHLGDAGRGVNRQLPHLGDAGRGESIAAYFEALSARLHKVRVACGEWDRVLGPSVTFRHGTTGVLLDPPYADEAERAADLYAHDSGSVAHRVREWAIANGDNPDLLIALCGYEGEHAMPEGWAVVEWKAKGGYGSQRRDGTNENAARERIWFSTHCLKPGRGQASLFDQLDP
jgi:DNA adenine methylase